LKDKPWDMKDMNHWLPVDLYVGGIEHAILHLLYARFYVKVLYDLGHLSFEEPFSHLFNQGMILKYSEKSGLVEKMSKSKGNVVSPDEIVSSYGADALRLYIMFMGPPELDCEWQDSGLEGMKRFLNRLWDHVTNTENIVAQGDEDKATIKRLHKFLHDFQDRLVHMKPNTAISACMEWVNDLYAHNMKLSKESIEKAVAVMSVFIPHMASEILGVVCRKKLGECSWPAYDPVLIVDESVTIVIQVNGKHRGTLTMPRGSTQEQVQAKAQEEAAKWLSEMDIKKVVFVPNRLINFVGQLVS